MKKITKTITLEEAHKILQNASAVIIDEHALVYPSLWELTGDDENQFMYLSWEDEGQDYYMKFCEGDNREVHVFGSSLFLYDTDANDDEEKTKITILSLANLE